MAKFKYNQPVQAITVKTLNEFELSGWKKLISDIQNNKPIDLNINFTDAQNRRRLCELYDLIVTCNIDPDLYQRAITQLLVEHFEKTNDQYVEKNFTLIQVIDYIQPSKYYPALELLVTSANSAHLYHVKTPTGFSMLLFLLNAIMIYDYDGTLLEFLKGKQFQASEPPFEYYQVVIRYLYTHKNEIYFAEFMNQNFQKLENVQVRQYVLMSIDEIAFERRNLSMVFNWLFINRKELTKNYPLIFDNFRKELLAWSVDEEDKLSKVATYYSFVAFLRSGIPDTLDRETFVNLLKEMNIKNRASFLVYLGTKNPGLTIREHADELLIHFTDSSYYTVPEQYLEDADWLEKGIRSKTAHEVDRSRMDLSLSDATIQQSLI